MKKILLLISILTLSTKANTQDFPFGVVNNEELAMTSYKGDTSAHALVLNEHGNAKITETGNEELRLVFDYHTRIKIFDKQGAGEGNFKVELYNGNSDNNVFEDIEDIKGVTLYKE
jgi:hypothetical protein